MSCICIVAGALQADHHVGEVPAAEVVLGVRSVSGFFGTKGTAFFEGEVDSATLGLFGDAVGLELFCEPSCSHCFSRSAILPGLLLPFVSAADGIAREDVGAILS